MDRTLISLNEANLEDPKAEAGHTIPNGVEMVRSEVEYLSCCLSCYQAVGGPVGGLGLRLSYDSGNGRNEFYNSLFVGCKQTTYKSRCMLCCPLLLHYRCDKGCAWNIDSGE
ncbi:unnamed protein product [Sphenostylis stenocarpa]|uniref:Uncharacterized protein n=1 Tax=Sphenostylis stenocarpa TaxID=92480 RepID=A0AA86SI19_9FABA|nr:unnamed protein product [Sphenostylis stenocarpa]